MSEAAPHLDPDRELRAFTVFPGRPPVTVRRGDPAPFGWWPAVCIALVAAIDRIEYNLLAGALPKIQEEFGFGDAAGGAIATAGSLAAVILLLPAGRLADTARRNWTIAGVVAVWSLLTVGTGLAGSFLTLFTVRMFLGAAGQLYNPSASSLLADFYPGPGRTRAFGYERMAYFGGLPIGVIAGGALAETVGWRTGFLLVAVPGLVVAVLVLTLREPDRGTGDRLTLWYRRDGGAPAPPAGTERRADSPTPPPLRTQLRELLRIRTLRTVVTGLSILIFGLGGLFYWMPSYYNRFFGLGEAEAAAVAGGSGLVGIVAGIVTGSWLGDRERGPRKGRRIAIGGAGLLFGTFALAGAVALPVLVPQALCFTLANFGFAAALANLTAANADVVAAERRGLGFAVLQLLVTLGGSLGPWLIGLASDATGSLRTAFLAVLLPLLVGSVVVLRGRGSYDADAAEAARRSA
ncbi:MULTISPECIES: MFS transporter [unclassified Streptomyces]|uniref:MFS transporter n=1 Tax=unclassified Streptomyces TaxID=2593676 RepID=UPI00226D50E3|nr:MULTISPECIES: MFS transporter [unclassified Streptomyces]MCY0930165.1 MFS transporter [Streptomyces sp. H27-H1]MDJ0382198.1 MFS transporter [Streptomyces sp. G-G2]